MAIIYITLMRKKMEKGGGYALASSSISDIPRPLASGQGQYYGSAESHDLKQSSSLYLPYSQEQSRGQESMSLNFSTARPFYDEITQENYLDSQMGQKPEYNIQQARVYSHDRSTFRKSPNKKIMIYSYSNVFSLNKIIETLIKKVKKRTFEGFVVSLEWLCSAQNFIQSPYSRKEVEADRVPFYQRRKKAVKVIESWLCYQLLREKRRVMNLIISCSEQKKSSLSLSQSLRISQQAEQNQFLTGFRSYNEISISQGLPQQTQESLVYNLQNQEPLRKETTQSTLEKYPTQREEQYCIQMKRGSLVQASSDKSSPVYKLKALANSPISLETTMSNSKPLPLYQQKAPSPAKRERAFQQPRFGMHEQFFREDEALLPDVINKSREDDGNEVAASEGVWEAAKMKKFEESSRYSQVSNYQLNSSKNHQETDYVKNNLAVRVPFEQKVSSTTPFLSTKEFIKYEQTAPFPQYSSSIITPKFTSQVAGSCLHDFKQSRSIQQPIHQLENDRIRIFEPPCKPSSQNALGSTRNSSNVPFFVPLFQQATNLRNQSSSPNNLRPIHTRIINSSRQIAHPKQEVYFLTAHHPLASTVQPPFAFNQRLRTQAPVVFFQPPKPQRQPPMILKKNERKIITHSPNMLSRFISPQPLLRNCSSPESRQFPPTHILQKVPFQSQDRTNSPRIRSPVRAMDFANSLRNIQQKNSQQRHMAEQPNEYELQIREKRKIRAPVRQVVNKSRLVGIRDRQIQAATSRAKSSASSPILQFNYKSAQEGKDELVSNRLTKNSSQISRPKSMNFKLQVTLKHKG